MVNNSIIIENYARFVVLYVPWFPVKLTAYSRITANVGGCAPTSESLEFDSAPSPTSVPMPKMDILLQKSVAIENSCIGFHLARSNCGSGAGRTPIEKTPLSIDLKDTSCTILPGTTNVYLVETYGPGLMHRNMTHLDVADYPEPSRLWRLWRGRGFMPLFPAMFCAAGCSRSPSQEILGSFFPAWLLCSVIGVAAAVVCRVVLGAVQLHQYVLAPALAYLAVAVAVTLFSWLIWFGQ